MICSPRDLNNFTALNGLSREDMDEIWFPQLSFVNALGPYQTTVDELTTGVLVREDEVPLDEDLSAATEGYLNTSIFGWLYVQY